MAGLRKILTIGAIVLIAYVLYFETGHNDEGGVYLDKPKGDEQKASLGYFAPQFEAPRLKGGNAVKLSDYAGKTVLLTFFAPWCNPCKEEMPWIKKMAETLGPDKFQVVGVAVEYENEAAVGAVTKSLGFDFPVAMDAARNVKEKYGVHSYPSNFVLDSSGVIRMKTGWNRWNSPQTIDLMKKIMDI